MIIKRFFLRFEQVNHCINAKQYMHQWGFHISRNF